METPTRYLLMIQWENLEAHTINFRESERFMEWRKGESVFFEKPIFVEHFEETKV